MGCFYSKKDITELHPNVYRVVNIDENGEDLCSGQLEITESDIILYREGRDSIIWPLHSLRRYGFEAEIFSFESGRRCETGEGIYAFRCRRASYLFRTLQQQIQLRNVIHDSVPYPVSRMTPSPQGRQTLQASVIHRSSIDNGQADTVGQANNSTISNIASHNSAVMRNATQSPRSPSSADILEVMPLNPQSQAANNHVTNIYQVRDFKREHNNNQESTSEARHLYSNDLSRDLAMLRSTLRQEAALSNLRDLEEEDIFLDKNRYVNETIPIKTANSALSPTLSSSSEHYAQLSIEQQETVRLYVNVIPNDNSTLETDKSEVVPTTPLTPKQVEYCNLNINNKPEVNSYANLMLGDMMDSVKNVKPSLHFTIAEQNQKCSESDTFTSMSPVEELEVNYAVLDIESNKDGAKIARDLASPESQSYTSSKNESTASYSSQTRGRLMSQNSLEKVPATTSLTTGAPSSIGYTTIDFDKTVALTSVAGDKSSDGSRKTRHNSSSVICGSPSSTDRSSK